MSLELFEVCCEVKVGRPGKAVSMVGRGWASLGLSEQLCPQQGLGYSLREARRGHQAQGKIEGR